MKIAVDRTYWSLPRFMPGRRVHQPASILLAGRLASAGRCDRPWSPCKRPLLGRGDLGRRQAGEHFVAELDRGSEERCFVRRIPGNREV
ncbi:MAG: hypothetical protein FD153_166 [Rhodospirillaceae bacterium]|nr:MAG: hypothetical protein FD153_166 [Rhodospirillaceae bacterium]